MESCVSRALQILMLTKDQLQALQEREQLRGYAIPNWNIQTCFGLGTIKDYYSIPDDPTSLEQHGKQVKQLIVQNDLLKIETEDRFYNSSIIDSVHAFDWGVWNKREFLDFGYKGETRKRGRLKDLVEEAN